MNFVSALWFLQSSVLIFSTKLQQSQLWSYCLCIDVYISIFVCVYVQGKGGVARQNKRMKCLGGGRDRGGDGLKFPLAVTVMFWSFERLWLRIFFVYARAIARLMEKSNSYGEEYPMKCGDSFSLPPALFSCYCCFVWLLVINVFSFVVCSFLCQTN